MEDIVVMVGGVEVDIGEKPGVVKSITDKLEDEVDSGGSNVGLFAATSMQIQETSLLFGCVIFHKYKFLLA